MSLKRRLSEPGVIVSVLVHVGALAATLIAFSHNEKFDDLQETVPVEIVTANQFNQIMKGDRSAKEVHPEAVAKAEAAAPEVETPPTPPTPEKSEAPPPPPPPPMPPVRAVEQPPPTPAPPPPPVAVLPPPRPETPEPETAPPVPTPPIRDVQAEPVAPKPVPKPAPPKPAPKAVPTPPVVPHPVVAKLPEPKPPKPRPVEKPKLDEVAKLMDEAPPDPPPTPHPAPAKVKPSHTASDSGKFDPTDISKLLNTSAPAPRPATNRDAGRTGSLGSPTANAPKMAPSMWAGLDGLMEDQYRACWSYLGLGGGQKYIPQVRVVYGVNGGLEGEPVLVNPPSDPALRSLAESALRAVRRCNPLKIPDQYAPYYDQWRGRVLRFDPEEMAG